MTPVNRKVCAADSTRDHAELHFATARSRLVEILDADLSYPTANGCSHARHSWTLADRRKSEVGPSA
jgi:hypothetical protein